MRGFLSLGLTSILYNVELVQYEISGYPEDITASTSFTSPVLLAASGIQLSGIASGTVLGEAALVSAGDYTLDALVSATAMGSAALIAAGPFGIDAIYSSTVLDELDLEGAMGTLEGISAGTSVEAAVLIAVGIFGIPNITATTAVGSPYGEEVDEGQEFSYIGSGNIANAGSVDQHPSTLIGDFLLFLMARSASISAYSGDYTDEAGATSPGRRIGSFIADVDGTDTHTLPTTGLHGQVHTFRGDYDVVSVDFGSGSSQTMTFAAVTDPDDGGEYYIALHGFRNAVGGVGGLDYSDISAGYTVTELYVSSGQRSFTLLIGPITGDWGGGDVSFSNSSAAWGTSAVLLKNGV
jgi:hypothetical protein